MFCFRLQTNIFEPELIPAKTNGDKIKILSFFTKKTNKIVLSALTHAIILCLSRETDIRTRIISGPQSFYFMINFFCDRKNIKK